MGRTALRLATGAPLLALAWYVVGLTPSVPLFDHWPLFDLYHAIATGQAGVRDFVAPHNGIHVIVLPRLFLSTLALATDWSMQAEILVSFAIVLATFFAMTRIAELGAGPRPITCWPRRGGGSAPPRPGARGPGRRSRSVRGGW